MLIKVRCVVIARAQEHGVGCRAENGHARFCQGPGKGCIGCIGAKHQCVRVHSLDPGKIQKRHEAGVVRGMPFLGDGRKAVDHRLSGHRAAVVKQHPIAQRDAPRLGAGLFYGLRQAREELQIAVETHQGFSDAHLVRQPAKLARPWIGCRIGGACVIGNGQAPLLRQYRRGADE